MAPDPSVTGPGGCGIKKQTVFGVISASFFAIMMMGGSANPRNVSSTSTTVEALSQQFPYPRRQSAGRIGPRSDYCRKLRVDIMRVWRSFWKSHKHSHTTSSIFSHTNCIEMVQWWLDRLPSVAQLLEMKLMARMVIPKGFILRLGQHSKQVYLKIPSVAELICYCYRYCYHQYNVFFSLFRSY